MRKLLVTLILLAVVAAISSKAENTMEVKLNGEMQPQKQDKPQEQHDKDDKEDCKEDKEDDKKEEKEVIKATLDVQGQASTTVFAGLIKIGIEFTSSANCATEALKENTIKVKNALREIRKLGCNEESISTVYFAITPHYKECEGKPTSEVEGYFVTQTIEVTVTSKKLAAHIVDTTGNCGGVLLWVNWDISAKAVRLAKAKLIKEAVDDAVFKARKVAKRLGFRLVSVTKVKLNDSDAPTAQTFKTFAGAVITGINKTLSLTVDISFNMIKIQKKKD